MHMTCYLTRTHPCFCVMNSYLFIGVDSSVNKQTPLRSPRETYREHNVLFFFHLTTLGSKMPPISVLMAVSIICSTWGSHQLVNEQSKNKLVNLIRFIDECCPELSQSLPLNSSIFNLVNLSIKTRDFSLLADI